MKTPAIHKAIQLNKHPEEMSWLCFPDSDLPEGMSELLRLAASKEQLIKFAKTNDLNAEELTISLFSFIEKTMLNEKNSDEKILGTDEFSTPQQQKFHFELLIQINQASANAEQNSILIEKAYKALKIKEEEQGVISFSENRKQTKNYNQTTQKTEVLVSYTMTAMAVVSACAIILLVTMTGKIYGPSNPELVTSNNKNIVENNNEIPQQLVKITSLKSETNTLPLKQAIQATSTTVQNLLKNLEIAYEKGDIDIIKPILANAPEIKNQTEKQLNEKLETIFQITSERKMVLFDFNWSTNSGILEGQGKFLSRYQLVGENKWFTRKGTAMVSAKKENNNFKVTQLILENQNID